jgi:hypothetical protein
MLEKLPLVCMELPDTENRQRFDDTNMKQPGGKNNFAVVL